jgi:hypothetical protein
MGGFLAPRLDRAIIRDRFAFRLQCVVSSLTDTGQIQGSEQGCNGSKGPDRNLASHMLSAVRRSGNAELIDAYQRVSGRLIILEPAERRLFKNFDVEHGEIVELFEASSGELPDALRAYHYRRIEAAPLLILEAEAEWAPSPHGG